MTNTNTKYINVDCGRCVRGTYYYTGGSGPCYTCEGTGKVRVSRAKHEALVAYRIANQAAWEASCAREADEERRTTEAFLNAEALIQAGGDYAGDQGALEAARDFFRANRTDSVALGGLIMALRQLGFEDESNKLVRFRNAM